MASAEGGAAPHVAFDDKAVDDLFNGLSKLMADKTCRDLVRAFPAADGILQFDTTTPTVDAYQQLADRHFSSAPVKDAETGRYIGFVDMMDLTKHLVNIHTMGGVSGSTLPDTFKNLRNILAATSVVIPKPVLDVVNISKDNPWCPVRPEDPAMHALELLCSTPPDGGAIHRVPVVSESGELVGVLTQSNIIHFLNEHIVSIGPVLECPVELGPVTAVKDDDMALKAFEVMIATKVTGLPVVSSTSGKPMSVISSSDVRLAVKTQSTHLIGTPVLDFVQAVRMKQEAARGDGATHALVMAIPSSATYADALRKLAVVKVHRLYIEDPAGNLVGVISLKDIIAKLVHIHREGTSKK